MPATLDQARDLLARLVARASVNPVRTGAVGPPFGEAAMADLLAGLLAGWGAEVERREFAPGRVNLIARFPGEDDGRTLLLEAHADTVSHEGMTIPPFTPVVRNGRLFGRGSCDCKGPMTAMLLGIRQVLQERGRPPTAVTFVATGDEESGAAGARALLADGFRADAAVVAEPTSLAVVHAHKGGYRCRIEAVGRAAHSSDPAAGANAIRAVARAVEAIEGPLADALAARPHPVLGPPTVSVGTIRGGVAVNIVPERCDIEVDRRVVPDEDAAGIRAEFERCLAGLAVADPGIRYAMEDLEWYPPLVEPADGPVVGLVSEACRAVLGRADLDIVPWSANAGFFREAGIPSVLFGPGDIADAHTAEESIALADVVRAAEVYAEIVRRF